MFDKKNIRGFTLIELLIVVAIIGILAAIAIPGYLGMQERGRKGSVIRASESSIPDLQAWMNSVRKAGTVQEGLTEVDTDGNGVIEAGVDDNNLQLAASGVVTEWIAAHGVGATSPAMSPWNSALPLWTDGGVQPDITACKATPFPGQIGICYTPDQNKTVRQVFVVAFDNAAAPAVIHEKVVSAD